MVDTGNRTPPRTVVIKGEVLGMPDSWGNRFPVHSFVEFGTTDTFFLSLNKGNNPYANKFVFAAELTDDSGTFAVVSPNHPVIVPWDSMFIELSNQADLSKHKPQIHFAMIQPEYSSGYMYYDVGAIQTPWSAEPDAIAGFNGREYKYPGDFAQALAGGAGPFRSSGSLELYGLVGYPELEDLFKALERESKSGNTAVVAKLAKELTPVLEISPLDIRNTNDVFRIGLERYSNTRFNNFNSKEFKGSQLGAAINKVFGGRQASFFGYEGFIAFCAFIFTAGAVESGLTVHTKFGFVGNEHVMSITVT